MVKKNEKTEKKNNLNSRKRVADKKVNTKKVVAKNVDTNSTEVSKLIKAIKSNDAKAPVLKPKKKMRTKVAIISSATVAVAGAGIGVGAYVANQNKEYVITMYYQDGVENVKVNKVKDLKAPEVPGYTFVGWYKDASYEKEYKDSAKFEENSTVYGKYVAKKYTINFVENNGTDYRYSSQAVSFDSNIPFPKKTILEKVGYNFIGWALDENEVDTDKIHQFGDVVCLTETQELTFHAIWSIGSFDLKIEYKDKGALDNPENVLIEDVEFNTSIQSYLNWDLKYTNNSKYLSGYHIDGKEYAKGENIPMPGKNVVATPVWKNSTVSIQLDLNGASGAENTFEKKFDLTYGANSSKTLPTPTRTNYDFVGWSRTRDDQGLLQNNTFTLDDAQDENKEKVYLYAIWKATEYSSNIAFINKDFGKVHNNAGVEIESISATYGEQITISGYNIIIGEQTYTVIPNDNNFKTTYSANISKNTETWGSNTVISVEFVQKYIEYTIILNVADGDKPNGFVDEYKLSYEDATKSSVSLNSPIKTGYAFLGWSKTSNSNTIDFEVTQDGGNVVDYIFTLADTLEDFNKLGFSGKVLKLYPVLQANDVDIQLNIVNPTYGSVKLNGENVSVVNAKHDENISIRGNIITIGQQIVEVTAKEETKEAIYSIVKIESSQNKCAEGVVITIEFAVEYKDYTITLDTNSNGEATIGKTSYTFGYDNGAVALNTPTREHYTFLGWSKTKGTTAEYEYNGTSDIQFTLTDETANFTLYAIWEIKTYDLTISFENIGESVDGLDLPGLFNINSPIELNALTKVSIGGGGSEPMGYDVYAGINADGNKLGDVCHPKLRNAKQAYIIQSISIYDGEQWSTYTSGDITLTGDMEIRFNYQVETNTITFRFINVQDGKYYNNPKIAETLSDKKFIATEKFTVTPATNTNYTLSGWAYANSDGSYLDDASVDFVVGTEYTYENITSLTSYFDDVVYLAPVWEAKSYNVTITRDGKDGDQVSHDYIGADRISSVKYGTEYILPVDLECKDAGFFVSGYIVDGVTKKPGETIIVEADTTIAPVWGDKYAISFVVSNSYISGIDNDPVLLTPDVNAGGVVTTTLDAIAPTFADPDNRFTFLGWSESARDYVEDRAQAQAYLVDTTTSIQFSQSKTYYAVWQVNKVTYTVHVNYADYAVDTEPIGAWGEQEFTITALDSIRLVKDPDCFVVYGTNSYYIDEDEGWFTEEDVEFFAFNINDGIMNLYEYGWRDYYTYEAEQDGTDIMITFTPHISNISFVFDDCGENYFGTPTMRNKPETKEFTGFDTITLPEVEDVNGFYEFKGWTWERWVDGESTANKEVDFLAGEDLDWDDLKIIWQENWGELEQKLYPVWEAKEVELEIEVKMIDGSSVVTGENWGNVYFDDQLVNPGDKITVKYGDIILDPTNSVLDIAGKQLRFDRTYDNDHAHIQLGTYDISSIIEYTDDATGEFSFRVGGSGKITVNLERWWDVATMYCAHSIGNCMNEANIEGLEAESVNVSWGSVTNTDLPTLTYEMDYFNGDITFVGWATAPQSKAGDAYTTGEIYQDGSIIEDPSYKGIIYSIWNYGYTTDVLVKSGDPGSATYYEGNNTESIKNAYGAEISVRLGDWIDIAIQNNVAILKILDQFSREVVQQYTITFDSLEDRTVGIYFEPFDFYNSVAFDFVIGAGDGFIGLEEYTLNGEVIFVGYNDDNPTEAGYITAPSVSKDHYDFVGWNGKVDGSSTWTFAPGADIDVNWYPADEYTVIWPEELTPDAKIKVYFYPVFKAHKYTLEYSYTAGALDSSYDKSNLASVEVEYAPGKVIELVSPTYGAGYSFEGWWLPDSSSMGTTFALDDYIEDLADGDLLMVIENVCRDISLSIDATLSPQEIELGEVIFAGSENSVSTYLHHSSGGNILFDFTQGYDDVRYDMGVAFGLPGVRQNYTLLGYSRTPGGEPSWSFAIPVDEHIDTLTLYPIWQGNDRTMINDDSVATEWMNLVDGSGNLVFADLIGATYKQGQQVTLPGADEIALIQAMDCYKNVKITGWEYNGETRLPGAKITINESDDNPYILLNIVYEEITANVTFDFNGGSYSGEKFKDGKYKLTDEISLEIGTGDDSITPPNNLLCADSLGWEVYIDGVYYCSSNDFGSNLLWHTDIAITLREDLGITDGDHEVVFKLTYGEKELTYSIYSSITGEFIDGGYCSGTDIVLNYTEDQFALEGYKLSHFELDRGNGVIECQPLNGTFNDIRALVPNDNDPCPDLSVTAVYVKADQLLNFTVETAKDTIDCEWLEATAVGKNKLDISKVVALQNCTVRIGTNSVRIYPDSADSECSLYFPMGELSQYVGKTYAFSGSADFCNATYTIEGGADVESATTIKVLTTSSKTFTVPSNATGGELFLKVEVNSFDFSYTDFGQLYGLQIEQNTKSTDYEYYYDDYRLSSVSVDEITTDKADVYAYAKFTIPRAKESVKTINGVKKYFVGWSSDTDLSSVEYYPGEMWSYNSQAGLNLYPVYQEASEDGLTFTLSSNGQYYTVSGFAGDREYYVIPQSYKGIPVTRLSGSSERNTTTKAFIIPEGITFIDWNVFGYCTELTSLHVPSTVKSLSSYSCDLGGFENLNMLTFEKGSQLTSILGGVLAYNSSLKRIELPASITSIGDVGLSTNTKLQQITFEEGSQLSEIGYMVFSNCVSLKSFTIPENVTSIYGSTVSEDASFYGCINLKSVHNLSGLNIVAGSATHGMVAYYADLVVKGGELVEENNILYHIKDGDVIALVVTDKTLSTYTLREDTTILSNKIFNGCTNLESLDLPAGLKKIEGSDDWENGGAFANTTSLNELVIPGECEVGFLTFLNSGVNKISFEGYTSTELNLDYFTYAQEIVIPASVENLLPAVGGPIGTVSFEDPTNWYGVFKGLLVPYDEITDLTVYINNADMGIGMRKIDENIETYGHNYELSEDGTYYILTSLDEVYYPKVPTYYKGLPVKQLGDGVNYLRGPDDDSGYTPCLNLEFETDCQITTIADYAFFGAMLSFKNFILPSSVEYIGDYAFGYSEHYIEIIPAKVKYLGKCAFNYGINRFEIGEGWQYSEDGVTWNWVLDGTTTNLVSFYNANCENMMFRRVEEETQGVNYTLSSDRTHYIVSGGGSNNSEITIKASLYGLPVLGIAEQAFVRNSVIESVTFEEGCQIVNIPVGAFRYMSNLKTLILPDSVKTIEVSALGNNDNLETLILPSGLQSLASWSICNNPKLKTITIPATLTTIENGTFCGCTALEEVVFAEGSKCWEYGESAFEGCSSLKSINMPLDWITIRSNAFYGCGFEEIELPTCMVVASGAFGNCKNLTKLTISGLHNSGITGFKHVFTTVQDLTIVPMIDDYVYDRYYMDFKTNFPNVEKLSISGVKTIDQALFKDNTKLKTLVLSDGLMTIEDVAFSGCTALETVQLPSTLTTVGGYVFNGCINLSEVTIPSGSVLGNGMFCGCTNLTTVNFEDGWSGSIPASAFESCVSLSSIDLSKATSIGNQAFINCKLLTEASLTSSGTIGVSAFSGCSGLDSVEFSDGLTSIDNSAFNGCTALTYIDLPDSLLSIGESAFYNNTGLVEVNIGDSSQLNTIGDRAFQGCDKIKYWYMPSEVETVGPNAFGGLFSCSIISNASALNIKAEAGLNTPANGCIEYYVGQVYDHRVYVDELVVNGVKYYDAYSTQADKDNKTNRLDRIAYGYAAENAGGVTSLILDENTTVISYQAFSGCAFETITIPASVKMIQYKSLANNNSLKTITFEEESQLEYLGGGFYNSPLLESVNLEVCVNLEHIGRYAFYNCPVLTSITIPASVTRIDYSVFSGTSISSLSVSSTGWKYSTDRESWNLVLDGTVTSVAEFMKAHPEYYYKRVLKDIQIQGVNYTLSSDETYYIVSGAESGVTEIVIKDSLYDIPVTEIGANAFDGNKNIIRVEIPENVKIIGEYAFRSCTSITSIVIPVSVEGIRKSAFIGCTSLSYVEFGQNSQLTTIGEYSFRSCKLETITIPKNVTSIEEGAFYDCINLKIVVNLSELDIKLGSTDTAISLIPNYGYVAYYAALVVSGDEKYEIIEENNVKYAITNTQVAAMEMIDKNATTCSLRQDTTVIGYNVFGDLLETIKIPASVKIIGNFAFSFCGSLISVEFAENSQLTTIGEHVFESCYLLESIVIPASVTNIEYCTFYDCSALKSVKFDENSQLVRLGSSAFSGCSSLESIKIPAGVSVVGTNTFYNCTSLSSIEFAENSQLVSIKQGAFSNCDLLESIVIPASVTSIERYVFPENDNLTISFENSEGWQYKTSSSATTWNNVTSDIATFIKQNRNYYYRRVE